MNWMTNKPFPKSGSINEDTDDRCEHVEKDPSLAHWIFEEHDSWGVVGRYVACCECKVAHKEAEENEEEPCYDCGGLFKNKDLRHWRGFYFDAKAGEEPLLICKSCCEKEKHKKRIEQYKYDEEQERLNDDEDDLDWGDDYYEDDPSDHEFFDESEDDFQTHLNQDIEKSMLEEQSATASDFLQDELASKE
ncbi:hypothetical protein [Shewanella phage FishSpeaker]|nr:hypothetical protein [Shewanella phage FishSpeaker]